MKYILHVHGMHCAACTLLIESELRDHPNIHAVTASLKKHSVVIEGDFDGMPPSELAKELTGVLKKHGYSLEIERQVIHKKWADFKIAVPVAFGVMAAFVLLQKAGIIHLINTGTVTYGTALLLGIIASLSTCMAVVGGLVLSMSSTFAKQGDAIRPQLLFHVSRLISFFILGGVIGSIGSAFTLTATATFILNVFIGLIMLVLGINLLDVFHVTKRFQLTMPKFFSRHAFGIARLNHALTPLLVGVLTFFLPCGFTQSMQLYALSTGTFISGALTMFFFALGTLPILSLISFSSFSIKNGKKAGIFFKTAGLIVLFFALFNLINSFVVIGVIPPIFNF